jgi:transcriptional regulator with XRE-family HTH domain
MLKEVEITDPMDLVYAGRGGGNRTGIILSGIPSLLDPTFSRGTGKDTESKPHTQPKFSPSLLPYRLLSTTTGAELKDIDIALVLEVAFDGIATEYHITFELKDWPQSKPHTRHLDQIAPPDINSASIQAERLREISGLKVERLAELFGVSRTTYYKWMSGSPLHDVHREQLLEVLSLVEEAAQRLGSPGATNTWLLTPVSPGGKKPIDYLAAREYSTFRGFLLHIRTGRETFQPLAPSSRVRRERSREEVEDARERLRPRVWRDENDISGPGEEGKEE